MTNTVNRIIPTLPQLERGVPVGTVIHFESARFERVPSASPEQVRTLARAVQEKVRIKHSSSLPDDQFIGLVDERATPFTLHGRFSLAEYGRQQFFHVLDLLLPDQAPLPLMIVEQAEGTPWALDLTPAMPGLNWAPETTDPRPEVRRAAITQALLREGYRRHSPIELMAPLMFGVKVFEGDYTDPALLSRPDIAAYAAQGQTPQYEHDCERCLYYGRYGQTDLWFCPSSRPGGGSAINRFGSDGPDYSSMSLTLATPSLLRRYAGVMARRAQLAARAIDQVARA